MKNLDILKQEWNIKGEKYALEINEMVDFVLKNGWENWKREEPKDNRNHLADKVIELLRKANSENNIKKFRKDFPPAHAPFIKYFEEKGQSIEQVHFIENEKIVFLTGTPYQERRAYILNNDEVIAIHENIDSIGKSKKGNIFAIQIGNKIITTRGWKGETICEFDIKIAKDIKISQLVPFNNGMKILSVTTEGIFIIDKTEDKMIHPERDLDNEEWEPFIDMANATLSNDNKIIVVADQCSDHRILNTSGKQIGKIGPQSEYSHYCMFSEDDDQLITSSCRYYGGLTIGVKSEKLNGIEIEAWEESPDYIIMDEEMRVQSGIAYDNIYILGDALGYVRAINKDGELIWRHFLGSTIGDLAISDDKQTLWVSSFTGIIHKLKLNKGLRDKHTIGNSNHYEEFRLILWKNESIMKW